MSTFFRLAFVSTVTFRGWVASRIAKVAAIARIKGLSPEVVVYSNGWDAVYFLSGRKVMRTPDKVDKMNMRENQIYLQEIDSVKQALADKRAVVVWFNNFPDRWFQPSAQDLQADLPLQLIARETDGVIFR